jgi:hypothetical protein
MEQLNDALVFDLDLERASQINTRPARRLRRVAVCSLVVPVSATRDASRGSTVRDPGFRSMLGRENTRPLGTVKGRFNGGTITA